MAHKCDGCRYKGEHHEMMFRPFGVCTKEINLIEAEKAYNAEKCPYKKTNADRIRAMNNEELADYLAELGSEANNGVIYSDRPEEWLEWLTLPAEE